MKRTLLILTTVLMTSTAFADAIEDRQAAMKTIGQTMKGLSAMASGKADFDADKATMGLDQLSAAASSLTDFFPEGSGEGETEAAPTIWENPEGFQTVLSNFINDAQTATGAEDSFELADTLAVIGKNCKACHQDYRIEK